MLDDTDQSVASTDAGAAGAGSSPAASGVGPNYGGMALTAAGGITSAYGTYLAGKYNRRVAQRNAQMARMQEEQALQAGAFAAGRVTSRERIVQGQEQGAAAGGNVVANSGSNKLAQEATASASDMDRYLIETNARRQAFGFEARAIADTSQGRMAQLDSTMGVASTVANTGAQEWLESDPRYGGFRSSGIRFAQ